MSDPIVVDISMAIKQLQDNPELGKILNELAFGKLASDQILLRDELIGRLTDALRRLTTEASQDGLRQKAGWDCWLGLADEALAEADLCGAKELRVDGAA